MLEYWYQEHAQPAPVLFTGAAEARTAAEDSLIDQVFHNMIHHSMQMEEELLSVLRSHNILLPSGPYRLALFVLEEESLASLSGSQRYWCRMNVHTAMREHLTAALPDDAVGFLSVDASGLLCLIYAPTELDDALLSACRDTVDFAAAQGFAVHGTVGDRRRMAAEIQLSYSALVNFETSRGFFQEDWDRLYCMPDNINERIGDSEQRTRFESTFRQNAERISGAMQAGDNETAAEYMRDQLLRIAENCKGMPWPGSFNLTINRFIAQLQYRLTEQGLADWRYLISSDFSRDLISCDTLQEYLSMGETIVGKLASHYQQRSADRQIQLMIDIRTYVEQNATDVNIGLASVAREFHLIPRKISESFRAYYGESINDVIHRTRVARAKELLLTTNDSVQDIAAKVGYCSLATMYRAFADVEGIAPGSLRRKRKSDE